MSKNTSIKLVLIPPILFFVVMACEPVITPVFKSPEANQPTPVVITQIASDPAPTPLVLTDT